MGLFDKKRPEPDPVQPQPQAPPQGAAPKPAPAPQPAPRPSEPASYGIQNAIELMRRLPDENVPLVVEVVRKTLESLHVDITAIIEDAERKENRIAERVRNLEEEIREFEEEIAARKQEIAALTADRDETRSVKQRLELALGRDGGSEPKPSASKPSTPAPATAR